MVKERAYYLPVVLFSKENIDADKPIPEVNLPPVSFIGAPTRHRRIGIIQVSWDLEISVAVIITLGVPV